MFYIYCKEHQNQKKLSCLNHQLIDWIYSYRLGFIIDFLSKATLVGFMAGAAVIVSLQQLKGLLGIVHFTTKMQFIPVMSSVFSHRGEVIKLLKQDQPICSSFLNTKKKKTFGVYKQINGINHAGTYWVAFCCYCY